MTEVYEFPKPCANCDVCNTDLTDDKYIAIHDFGWYEGWLYCKDCEQKYKPHKCRVFVRQVLEGEDVSDTIIASPMKIEATDSMDEFMKWFERGDYKFIERDGTTTHKKGD